MANLKDLRVRINSVKNTRKITSAMKMVAASKLRRAQNAAEASRPYAERMARMISNLTASLDPTTSGPLLLSGTGRDETHLLVVMTADRGLCGGFNGSVIRSARHKISDLISHGKKVRLLCIGRKGRDALQRDYADCILESHDGLTRRGVQFTSAKGIAEEVLDLFRNGQFDTCTLIYNRFKSAISQEVTHQQLVPVSVTQTAPEGTADTSRSVYEYEPSEECILADLLPRNVAVQVYSAMLDSDASEQGARMSAMDNATRNAGDMINRLTLVYNRTRQAMITKELIEIISGAEAV